MGGLNLKYYFGTLNHTYQRTCMFPVLRKSLLLPALALLLLFACKSGEKLYNKGRYDEAVNAFVKKLQQRPQDETALRLLREAYNQSLASHEAVVNRYLVSNDALKWEGIKQEYRAMQALYNAIHTSPAALGVVTPKDYSADISGARQNAADVRYQRGVALLQQNNKSASRQAFDEFVACLAQQRDYKDAAALRDQAFAEGVTNVIVSRIEVRSPYYQFTVDQFRNSLVNDLKNASDMGRFVRYYDESELTTNNIRPDAWLQMQFFDFVVGETHTDRYAQDLSRDVVVQLNQQDSTGKYLERHITVRGTLTTITRTVITKGMMDYQLVAQGSNRMISQDRLPGSFTWQNQFAIFKGDDRVLDDAQRKLLQNRDVPPPPPQDLFMAFTRPIYSQMAGNLQRLSGVL
ncbi:hypothetical protein DCC81_23305 [Chitinophaga parva]|uniref:Tetratricopeptide repeat protein n=2 Tax=Chitinophaga parva TaxID=2169414 RepID=A0A2T7BDY8_9BACT|nr:hypothetical protein DCC81_23305 [Chitinophaga parva]